MLDDPRWTNVTLTLNAWINLATEGLGEEAKRRVRAEITSHYEDHIASSLASGSTQEAAHKAVIAALGEPQVAAKALRRSYLTDWQERFMVQLRTPKVGTVLSFLWYFNCHTFVITAVAFSRSNGITLPAWANFLLLCVFLLPFLAYCSPLYKVLNNIDLSIPISMNKATLAFSITEVTLLILYVVALWIRPSFFDMAPGPFPHWHLAAISAALYFLVRQMLFTGGWQSEKIRRLFVGAFAGTLLGVSSHFLWECRHFFLLLLYSLIPGLYEDTSEVWARASHPSAPFESLFVGGISFRAAVEIVVGFYILRKRAMGTSRTSPQSEFSSGGPVGVC